LAASGEEELWVEDDVLGCTVRASATGAEVSAGADSTGAAFDSSSIPNWDAAVSLASSGFVSVLVEAIFFGSDLRAGDPPARGRGALAVGEDCAAPSASGGGATSSGSV
jgi:hypothetical protein